MSEAVETTVKDQALAEAFAVICDLDAMSAAMQVVIAFGIARNPSAFEALDAYAPAAAEHAQKLGLPERQAAKYIGTVQRLHYMASSAAAVSPPAPIPGDGEAVEGSALAMRVAALERRLDGSPDNPGHLLGVLNEQMAGLIVENKTRIAELHALNRGLFACVVSSPEAMAYLEDRRPKMRGALEAAGLEAYQVERAHTLLLALLALARNEPTGLAGLVRRVWVDLLRAVEALWTPGRWTWRGAALFAGATAGCWLLARLV